MEFSSSDGGTSWMLKRIFKEKNKFQHLGMQQWDAHSKYSISKVDAQLMGDHYVKVPWVNGI